MIGMVLLVTRQGACAAPPPVAVEPQLAGIECVLRPDRTVYHPGEQLVLEGYVKNAGRATIKLPRLDFARQYVVSHLHVRTPSGEEFAYEPYAEHPLRSSLTSISPRGFSTLLPPRHEYSAFRKAMRVTWDLANWSSREHPHGPLSLRGPGEYRVWFEYRVPPVPGSPQDAWKGTAASNTLVLTVAELPDNERHEKATAEQLAAIQTLQSVAPTFIEGRELLQQAMIRAENEGLAEHLVDLCLQDARRTDDFIVMVSWRACYAHSESGRLQLGIDGPYLKTLALATIETIEHPPQDRNQRRLLRSSYALDATIAYLRFHPEDKEYRERLVKIAIASAKLPPAVQFPRLPVGPVAANPPPGREQPIAVPAAWSVLLELDVLHAGMPPEAAIEILGPPAHRSQDILTWYLNSPRHVNPGLEATLEGSKVKSFHRYSG
jgi:hypothetical protein